MYGMGIFGSESVNDDIIKEINSGKRDREVCDMTSSERAGNIKRFISMWSGDAYKEDGNTAPFWTALLRNIMDVPYPEEYIQFEDTFKHEQKGNPLYCDAWIPSLRIMIEQKAPGVALDAPYKRHGRTFQCAYEQAFEYDQTLPVSKRSKYIIACNFHEFWIYDMDVPEAEREPVKIYLKDLAKDYKKLAILTDSHAKLSHIVEVEVSVEAGEKVGKLYDMLLAEYKKYGDVTKDDLHALNVLCVRLVFCLYAEDAGLFGAGEFARYLESFRPENTRAALLELFRVLDEPKDIRDRFLSPKLASFPYVNGGLFHDLSVTVPPISPEVYGFLIDDMSLGFDWSKISPTIFGAVFESTLNPETRRKGGMHYTSIENIHKVIDPLFLDALKEKTEKVTGIPDAEKWNETIHGREPKANYRKSLLALQEELAQLTFLDPACGSGNFLTETFVSLRRLENRIISELNGGAYGMMSLEEAAVRVSINQFYGIEVNDFAVTVAKTALWIADSQMIRETEKLIQSNIDFLPLKNNANIHEGNALRLNWEDIVPKTKLNYIMGNPPFVGARLMEKSQKEEIFEIFNKIKNAGNLDYVAGWYKKAADLIVGSRIRVAFVSTNSITQGEQVPILWKDLFSRGVHIDFGYRTFRWDSEANLKAHVHCVIVGFSCAGSLRKRYIFSEGKKDEAENINGYLIDAPDIVVESRAKPLCKIPAMGIGNKPIDDGNYLFTKEEMVSFVKKEPLSEKYFRPWYGAVEFISQKPRYCLWLGDCEPNILRKMPLCLERIQNVRNYRLASKSEGTRKLAERPTRFHVENMPNTESILIPSVSSERRRYVPMGFLPADAIASNLCLIIPNATMYHFGILTSNIHMAWMRTVAGRLKSDYRYSKDIVYNNFPWPEPTEAQREKIERTAKGILDARALYPESSLADLYDPLTMPPELLKAHRENDRAVWEAYGKAWDITSEAACVSYLMDMYRKLTEPG